MLSQQKVLVTGAAGQLGKLLRASLRGRVQTLRLSDIAPMEPAQEGEELWPCDLTDAQGVCNMMRNIDLVVHLGASLNVDDWDATLQVNISGTYNVYEAARQAGSKRVVYASSHHAVGMYPTTEHLDDRVALRPDSLYGLSKCFGESTAQYYWDKFGLESVCMRIGSTRAKPSEPRELATWLSEPDFMALVQASLTAQNVKCSIVYGVSNNPASWWSNEHAVHLGYTPQDNAEAYRVEIQDLINRNVAAPDYALQGGKRAYYGLAPGGNEPASSKA